MIADNTNHNVGITCLESVDETINTQHQLITHTAKKHHIRFCFLAVTCFVLFYILTSVALVLPLLLTFSVFITISIWAHIEFSKQLIFKQKLAAFQLLSAQFNACFCSSDLDVATEFYHKLHQIVAQEPADDLRSLYAVKILPELERYVRQLEFQHYKDRLAFSYKFAKQSLEVQHWELTDNHPLSRVKADLDLALAKLTRRRKELQAKWDEIYNGFSWWNKLKYGDSADLSELDEHIVRLTTLTKSFNEKHGADLSRVIEAYQVQSDTALKRLAHQFSIADAYVDEFYSISKKAPDIKERDLLIAGGWAGAFGLSYSIWDDFMTTHAVYDALRSVNGNFEGMSDSDIWFETLWMSHDSLVGLTSLVKGAYFEQLVAMDTQGELFEHFNHPDTDIIIDGVAFQLKATDSVSYINSVDADIPVIATSEVAEQTDAIDSGFTNFELSADVDTAIDGIGVDVGDAMADGILAGLGGLGFFATINGINHAGARYDAGTPAEEAILQGLGVAVEGTAKTIVDASEMAYKVVSSRPSRAVGRAVSRTVLYFFDKMDEKIEKSIQESKTKEQ
ncbi:hypothetical protein [Shewanella frigidimarina]|uniref:hypothetical protein n=1 Tax=Shewanella frigidimarina TaxID=56812 RepID=UPI003D7BBCBF|tara:strand:- start:27721 stop:29415 length:1695 start_codon:yes stop_codon:yes gene_type:complete